MYPAAKNIRRGTGGDRSRESNLATRCTNSCCDLQEYDDDEIFLLNHNDDDGANMLNTHDGKTHLSTHTHSVNKSTRKATAWTDRCVSRAMSRRSLWLRTARAPERPSDVGSGGGHRGARIMPAPLEPHRGISIADSHRARLAVAQG